MAAVAYSLDSGEVLALDVPDAVAEVLGEREKPLREVTVTDLTSRRRDGGCQVDPDSVGVGVYVIPRSALLMRAVKNRMLTHYRRQDGTIIEVLVGYRTRFSIAGARPSEVAVTAHRLHLDRERATRWKTRGQPGQVRPTVKAPVKLENLAGGLGKARGKPLNLGPKTKAKAKRRSV
jgi:hypothetical protein